MKPNFTGTWKLIRGESEFGYLPEPKFRQDLIEHTDPKFRVVTHQIDSNGDNTVERNLIIGAAGIEVAILGRPRLISASWDGEELVLETRSMVSGKERLLEDRWSVDPDEFHLRVTRVHHLPGGVVRQALRFRAVL